MVGGWAGGTKHRITKQPWVNLCKTTIIHPHTHPPSHSPRQFAIRRPTSVNQHLPSHTRKLSSSAATAKGSHFQTATICPSWVSTNFQPVPDTTERKMCVTVSSEGRFMSQPPIIRSCCLCTDTETDSHWCGQTGVRNSHLCERATVSRTSTIYIYRSIHPAIYLSIVSVGWVLLADDGFILDSPCLFDCFCLGHPKTPETQVRSENTSQMVTYNLTDSRR